jgi:hypothetical protein
MDVDAALGRDYAVDRLEPEQKPCHPVFSNFFGRQLSSWPGRVASCVTRIRPLSGSCPWFEARRIHLHSCAPGTLTHGFSPARIALQGPLAAWAGAGVRVVDGR